MKKLIIGIGNKYRRDDYIGLIIAKKLHNLLNIDIVESNGDILNIIDLLPKYDLVVFIDAIKSLDTPGKLHRYYLEDLNQESERLTSTHSINIVEVIELAKMFDTIPKIIFYGIEGKDFSIGEGLSDEVKRSIEENVNKIYEDLINIA
ncbi:MAG: hydrogenase maturation protease [Candidatus Nitrosocaldaceae archaeon]|nr:MAG: hydrogenase maturation protease [Candidatus Nitrosocaldaceae archaeon]GIU72768.1 MAG: hydrogenase maturation protease [Candidatus Nitrosocaldaceae archaeon]GIU72832.1 MAG: hydrogenase maturation protease [Candidatus Nitrosocaldaceae archaeon]